MIKNIYCFVLIIKVKSVNKLLLKSRLQNQLYKKKFRTILSFFEGLAPDL